MARKAARPCTVCTHDKRHQIEIGLVHRVPARVLADRFNLGKDALLRHARNHLSPVQRAALLSAQKPSVIDLDTLRATESEGLLSQLVGQRGRLQQSSELALELGDVRASISAESAITANLTLVGKLLGQLVNTMDVRHSHSLLISPDYLKLRAALTTALRPYPEAARAVGAALHALESEAAADITPRKVPAVIEHVPLPLPPPPC